MTKVGKMGPIEREFHDRLYREMPQHIKSKWDKKSGIYALVRTDKDYETDPSAVLYVGQASNLVERWISHKTNALCEDSRAYWWHVYQRIRETRAHGIPMAFVVLEECGCALLDVKEEEYLRKYRPPFNYTLPAHDKDKGWYQRPQLHITK